MNTNDEVRSRLSALGRAEVGEPSAGFVSLLEERLRAIDVEEPAFAPAAAWPSARRRPPRRVLVPTFAALAVVFALGIGVLLDRRSPSYALTLDDPTNVSVVLPDGRIVEGSDGFRLTDGSRVVVGSGGSVRIGEQRLGEGDTAVIDGRKLRLVTTVPPPTVTTAAEPSTTRAPVVVPAPTSTDAPRRPDVTEPPATQPPVTEAPRVVETTRPVPTSTTTTRPPEQNLNLNLQLTVGEGRSITLEWRSITGAAQYKIVRTASVDGTPPEPSSTYPPAEPTVTVGSTEQLQWAQTVEQPWHTVRYRVIALDRAGNVVSRSAFAQATVP